MKLSSCPTCGRETSSGAYYCPGCGEKLRGGAGADAPAMPVAAAARAFAAGGLEHPALGLRGMALMDGGPVLKRLDAWVLDRLRLTRYGAKTEVPTVLCETGEEFYGALFADEPLSQAQMRELLAAQLAAAQAQAEDGGGMFGLFLGAHGCLVNGWLFRELAGLDSVAACLKRPEVAARIFTTAAHEKWGHGFISTCTELGREAAALDLDRFHYARRFPAQTVTTPRGVLLREKSQAVFQASRFVEEGWASWVDQLAGRNLAAILPECPEGGGGHTLPEPETLLAALADVLPPAGMKAMTVLLRPGAGTPEQATAAMAWLEEAEEKLNAFFTARFHRPARYVVGQAMCAALAARLGERAVPAAVALAGNDRYELEKTSVSDLVSVVAGNSGLNMNRRLAALLALAAAVPPGGDAAVALARAAHDRLSWTVPEWAR